MRFKIQSHGPFKNLFRLGFLGAVVGGFFAYTLFGGHPEKALQFTSQAQDTFGQGLGIFGFFGLIFWNLFVTFMGALFGGIATMIAAFLFFIRRTQKQFKNFEKTFRSGPFGPQGFTGPSDTGPTQEPPYREARKIEPDVIDVKLKDDN